MDFSHHSGRRNSVFRTSNDQNGACNLFFIHLRCLLPVEKPETNLKSSAAGLVNTAFIGLFLLFRGKKVKRRIDGFIEGLPHGCLPEGPSEQNAPEALDYRWRECNDPPWRSGCQQDKGLSKISAAEDLGYQSTHGVSHQYWLPTGLLDELLQVSRIIQYACGSQFLGGS